MSPRVSDDPRAMYYVVRKDVPLGLGQAMALAGAAAVRCRDELGTDPRLAEAFDTWRHRPRKIALRASAAELDELRAVLPGVYEEPGLLCLAPMRKSERPPLLASLRPFTDAPRPREEPGPPADGALTYVVRPGVIRTTGKAIAQAGHAALMAADRLDAATARRWREAGLPGALRLASAEEWEQLKIRPEAIVVTDAGLTQVEAGTETVIALPPAAAGSGARAG